MEKIIRQIGLRIFQGMCVAIGVSTLTFFLLVSMPGDLALKVTMGRYGEDAAHRKQVEHVRQELELDRHPLWLYGQWVMRTLRFDLGNSMLTGSPVVNSLGFHMGLTLKLAGAAMLFSLFIALPMGIGAALRPGSAVDTVCATFSSLMVSFPSFLLGALLILLMAVRLGILPAAGFQSPSSVILPAVTLGLGLAALSNRVIRNAALEVRNSFHFQFARIKGLSGTRLLMNHGIKNGAVPVITFLALQLAHVLDGIVVLENLFNWPGIGFLLLESIRVRDIPMIQAVTLCIGLSYVGVNLIADLICAWIDPRRLLHGGEI